MKNGSKRISKWHTFHWHPHYFPCFIVSVSRSHNACYYSQSTQAKRKSAIWGWTVQEQDRKQSSACKIWPWKPLTHYITPKIFSMDLRWSQKWFLEPLNRWKSANRQKSPISDRSLRQSKASVQVPGLNCVWQGFKTWNILQDNFLPRQWQSQYYYY